MSELSHKSRLSLLPWPNPNWKENPYQKLLYRDLRSYGVDIKRTPPLFNLLSYWPKSDWLHLNWPSRLYEDTDPATRQQKLAGFLAVLERWKERSGKILWTFHNKMPHDVHDVAFHCEAYKRLVALCDLIHVHFPSAVNYLAQRYGVSANRVVVVPHGHYGDYYGSRQPKEQARDALQIPADVVVILCFGYLRKYKGVASAVEALGQTSNPELRLLIAGEPESSEISGHLSLAADNDRRILLRLRKFSDDEISTIFSCADIFLFTSKEFFTSGSVMLAVTYDLPLIGIAENHLELFSKESFFQNWQPATTSRLAEILEQAPRWLSSLEDGVMRHLKQGLDWRIQAEKLAAALHRHN